MTKEEKIKEAWGNISDKINEDGWLYFGYCVNGWDDVEDWLDENNLFPDENYYDMVYNQCDNGDLINVKIRPKSLQGIGDNNGWTRIESEDDLPKEEKDYWVVDSDGEVFICFFDTDYKAFTGYFHYDQKGSITHFQPIHKPKSPIY